MTMQTPIPGDTVTFRDDFAGYEFAFPANWHMLSIPVIPPQEPWNFYGPNIVNWDPADPNAIGLEKGGTKVDVTVQKGAEDNLAAAVAAEKAEWEKSGAPATIVSEETVNLGGLEAVRFHFESPTANVVRYLAVLHGNTLHLAGFGDLDLADSVMRTFRPTKKSAQAA